MKKKNGSDFKGKTTPTKNKKGTKSILVRRCDENCGRKYMNLTMKLYMVI